MIEFGSQSEGKTLMSIRRSIIALAGLALIVGTANAQSKRVSDDKPEGDILGSWTFATKPYRQGQCIMTGTMVLSPQAENGDYGCELTAVEECSMWGKSVVVQSCTVTRFGNQVTVRSRIEEMLETKEGAGVYGYVPDNFALTVQSENRMYGSLISAATAPAEFIRNLDGIS